MLARRFEQDRTHLRDVAYRMLGSLSDAEDAVQETWLRLDRADTADPRSSGADSLRPAGIENLTGWLTTVVARVCLDMLRARTSRTSREASDDAASAVQPAATTPEQDTVLANEVGLALLVVLSQLDAAERVAFVLHDMFSVPFDEIAEIVGRTSDAARQLASRARRRVQGAPRADASALASQAATVAAFLTAMRAGDFNGLVAVLDPDVVLRTGDKTTRVGGAKWAKGAVNVFGQYGMHVDGALVDGSPGVIFAPGGTLERALRLTVVDGRITEVEILADPAQLAAVEVAVLPRA
jgi:RNA polymerase sigma factor (sigma-70 family)